MKTQDQIAEAYKANETEVGYAADNALMLMQDKYGFAKVTMAFIDENEAEFLELFESSLEALVAEGSYR